MGAHHFKLHLVPPGATPKRDNAGLYVGDFLLAFPIADSTTQRLRQIFATTNHWGRVEEYISGSDWGSDLRICHFEDGKIAEVTFRYAPSADPLEKLREFVDIAKNAGCFLLVEPSGAIIEPDFEQVFAAFRNHHSFRFLSDPQGAIVEAAKKVNEKIE